MFEDFSDENRTDDVTSALAQAADRAVLHAIWSRRAIGDLGVEEGWAILAARYPDDARFALFGAFWGIGRHGTESGGAYYSLRRLELVAASDLPAAAIRDLLSVARTDRTTSSGPDRALATRFESLAARFDGARADPDEARRRLGELERNVIDELHDRTLGNRPLVTQRKVATAANDHAALVAKSEGKPEIAYGPSVHLVAGDRVRHAKFGLGIVLSRRGNKAEIAFGDERRTLICT